MKAEAHDVAKLESASNLLYFLSVKIGGTMIR